MASRPTTIEDTDSTINAAVKVTGEHTLDEMEAELGAAADGLGMYFSHVTNLSEKKFPGNRHWHLKTAPDVRGCLDITYWPSAALMWVSMRRAEPTWVHENGRELVTVLERQLHR